MSLLKDIENNSHHRWIVSVFGWALSLLVILMTIRCFAPPPPALDTTTPLDEFSAGRAMSLLKEIAAETHPVGTPAHQRVLDFIVAELKKLGISPQLQDTVIGAQTVGLHKAAWVKNIYAKIPGTANTKAVLLSSHFDSVPFSHGASDDGSGVVALLETARALKHSPHPLKNDILLLFTDAEEEFLLGAAAFIAEHPWKSEVGIALNFEARGNHGPSAMFQTSDANAFMIDGLAKAAPFPTANSLISSLSKALPNETDLLAFKRGGLLGMDFAYAGGLNRYHTYMDSIETVDPASIQHHGSYALSLARYFGNLDLRAAPTKDNRVYFDLFGRYLISYPEWLARLLGLLTVAGFIWIVWICHQRPRTLTRTRTDTDTIENTGSYKKAFLYHLLTCGAVLAIAVSLQFVLTRMRPPSLFINYPEYFIWPYLCLALGVFLVLYSRFERKVNRQTLALGALTSWAILTFILAVFAPAASYPFQWSLLSALPGFVLEFSLLSTALGMALTLPALMFSAYLIFSLFTLENGGAPAITALVFVFSLPFIFPLLGLISIEIRKYTGILLISVGIFLALTLTFSKDFNPSHPQPSYLIYGVDSDQNEAFWVTEGRQPDWVTHYVPKDAEEQILPCLSPNSAPVRFTSAPLLDVEPPAVELISDQVSGNVRTLSLHVRSRRGARCMTIWEESGLLISQTELNGKPFRVFSRFSPQIDKFIWESLTESQSQAQWKFNFCALPPEGFKLKLQMPAGQKARFRVVDESLGLPVFKGAVAESPTHDRDSPTTHDLDFPGRPSAVIPNMWSDKVLISRLVSY